MEHRNFTSVKTRQQLLIIFPESLSFSLISRFSRLLDTLNINYLKRPFYTILDYQGVCHSYIIFGKLPREPRNGILNSLVVQTDCVASA